MTHVMRNEVSTRSGILFNFVNIDQDNILLDDIVWSLSMICRFAGSCSFFYSVAEHSVNVGSCLPNHLRKAGLMHDAAEAYIGDIVTPIKQHCQLIQEIEDNVLKAIFNKFEITWPSESEWLSIKDADKRMLAREALVLVPHSETWDYLKDIDPAKRLIIGFSPESARERFLEKFKEW